MANFCTNCGTKLEKNTFFCTNCGNKVDRPDKQPETIFSKIKKEIGYIDESIAPEQYKYFDELIESDEIKSKIKKYNIDESKIRSIRSNLKDKLISNQRIMSNNEIQNYLNTQLENEIKENEFKENREKYLENVIKDSYHNIKLATFEKQYVNNIKLNGPIDEMKKEINTIAKGIINTHKKIGEYDFAGILIEEGRFKSVGSVFTYPKPVTQESSKTSNVFLKIFDDKIKIVGSEIKPFFSLSTGRDMTIYFTDITSINYTNERFGEIYFDLINQTRLTFRDYEKDDKYLKIFYNLSNKAWEKFKNNKNENDISATKNEVIAADELMKYAELYEKGILNEDEFNAIKKKLLQL